MYISSFCSFHVKKATTDVLSELRTLLFALQVDNGGHARAFLSQLFVHFASNAHELLISKSGI